MKMIDYKDPKRPIHTKNSTDFPGPVTSYFHTQQVFQFSIHLTNPVPFTHLGGSLRHNTVARQGGWGRGRQLLDVVIAIGQQLINLQHGCNAAQGVDGGG